MLERLSSKDISEHIHLKSPFLFFGKKRLFRYVSSCSQLCFLCSCPISLLTLQRYRVRIIFSASLNKDAAFSYEVEHSSVKFTHDWCKPPAAEFSIISTFFLTSYSYLRLKLSSIAATFALGVIWVQSSDGQCTMVLMLYVIFPMVSVILSASYKNSIYSD